MKLRVPSYYKEFTCLAGACRHSCCVGWEVDVDEDTAAYYETVEGVLGERLRRFMRKGEDGGLLLTENGRCPFLNEENLCDICIGLGEEALSEVCTEYPRFSIEYGDVLEKSMALSCEEVGRLIFSGEKPFSWEEIVLEGTEEEDTADPDGAAWYRAVEQARDHVIAILEERSRPVSSRLVQALRFAGEVQEHINRGETEKIGGAISRDKPGAWTSDCFPAKAAEEEKIFGGDGEGPVLEPEAAKQPEKAEDFADSRKRQIEEFDRRLAIYGSLEVLDEEWERSLKQVKEAFSGPDRGAKYVQWRERFLDFIRHREFEYEHLLVYFIFRYQMQTVYDSSFACHVMYAALSFRMIQDMDMVRFMEKGTFTLEDRIDTARIYSREVEHSEENLEILAEHLNWDGFEPESFL